MLTFLNFIYTRQNIRNKLGHKMNQYFDIDPRIKFNDEINIYFEKKYFLVQSIKYDFEDSILKVPSIEFANEANRRIKNQIKILKYLERQKEKLRSKKLDDFVLDYPKVLKTIRKKDHTQAIFKYVEGVVLKDFINIKERRLEPLNNEELVKIVSAIKASLDYLHSTIGIVHGDVTSSNIILYKKSNDDFLASFIDYESARKMVPEEKDEIITSSNIRNGAIEKTTSRVKDLSEYASVVGEFKRVIDSKDILSLFFLEKIVTSAGKTSPEESLNLAKVALKSIRLKEENERMERERNTLEIEKNTKEKEVQTLGSMYQDSVNIVENIKHELLNEKIKREEFVQYIKRLNLSENKKHHNVRDEQIALFEEKVKIKNDLIKSLEERIKKLESDAEKNLKSIEESSNYSSKELSINEPKVQGILQVDNYQFKDPKKYKSWFSAAFFAFLFVGGFMMLFMGVSQTNHTKFKTKSFQIFDNVLPQVRIINDLKKIK